MQRPSMWRCLIVSPCIAIAFLMGCSDDDSPTGSGGGADDVILGVWSDEVEEGLHQFTEYRSDGTYVFNFEKDGTAIYGLSGRYALNGDQVTTASQFQFSWLDGEWSVGELEGLSTTTYSVSGKTLTISAPGESDPTWTKVTGKTLVVPQGAEPQ